MSVNHGLQFEDEIVKSDTFDQWLQVVVLLAGGDKRTQDIDIKRAIEIAKDWKE